MVNNRRSAHSLCELGQVDTKWTYSVGEGEPNFNHALELMV